MKQTDTGTLTHQTQVKDMTMVTTATMPQPPPPPRRRPPPPPPKRSPPPPKGPPPPPPRYSKRSGAHMDGGRASKVARKGPPPPPPAPQSKQRTAPPPPPSLGAKPKLKKAMIRKPTVLRDVNAFQEKYQVGQGTYGSVFVGADKVTGEIVALKRINTEQEENGFPITALREVKILKALDHKNVVKLKEIVTSKEKNQIPKNVFMVFEYHEYDLTGILETSEIRFTRDHVKSWAMQLLLGVNYMHINNIIHRDLKASNLLINRKGELVIADWGLARSYNSEMKHLTNGVVTLWYRPIELLLGCKQYSSKIDMWSVGCIVAEMFRRSGLLKGHNEASQLNLIFNTCGHPNKETWPDIDKLCPLWRNHRPRSNETPKPDRLSQVLRERLPHPVWMTDNAVDLISKLLALDPSKRYSASQSLSHDYFYENPKVKKANELHMNFGVSSVHEWEARKKHEHRMNAGKRKK